MQCYMFHALFFFLSFLTAVSHFQEPILYEFTTPGINHPTYEWLKTMAICLDHSPAITVLIWSRLNSNDLSWFAPVSADGWEIGWWWILPRGLTP